MVRSFSTGSYVVTRTARGDTVRGRVEPGTTTTITIQAAAVAPLSGDDVVRAIEGRRSNENRYLFTTTQMYIGGQDEPYEADTVIVDGKVWVAEHSEKWVDPKTGNTAYVVYLRASK